jgi:phosphoribosylaminoimidazolecarboxamide formyltransferase/IMP cyclohydrolase
MAARIASDPPGADLGQRQDWVGAVCPNAGRRGIALVSTGGTAKTLADAGLDVTEVAAVTQFPEMLDGRVKTLHPAIHGGLLARRDRRRSSRGARRARHRRDRPARLQPLPVRRDGGVGRRREDCVENIDIGGVALIRAAAKNHEFVAVVTDPGEYDAVLAEMAARQGAIGADMRRSLAAKAFALTAAYDAAIAAGWRARRASSFPSGSASRAARRGDPLRREPAPGGRVLPHRRKAAGRRDRAAVAGQGHVLQQLRRYRRRVRVGRRVRRSGGGHRQARQPVRRRQGRDLRDAWERALSPATRSARLAGSSRSIAPSTPRPPRRSRRFSPRWSSRLRSTRLPRQFSPQTPGARAGRRRHARPGGAGNDVPLARRRVSRAGPRPGVATPNDLKTVTKRAPSAAEIADLIFADTVAKHVKSNAIVFAKDGATVGIGAGQPSRVDSAKIAVAKAAEMAARRVSRCRRCAAR